jgi:hypothetical protein
MAVEALVLGEKVRIRKMTVNNTYGIIGVVGGNEPIARALDGFHVARRDVTGGTDQGKILHVARLSKG